MIYIKLSTLEYPRHQGDIRLEYPDMGKEFICPDTYALVHVDPVIDFDPATSVFEYNPPTEQNGKWIQTGFVRDLTEEEKQAYQKMQKRLHPLDAAGTEPDVIG